MFEGAAAKRAAKFPQFLRAPEVSDRSSRSGCGLPSESFL